MSKRTIFFSLVALAALVVAVTAAHSFRVADNRPREMRHAPARAEESSHTSPPVQSRVAAGASQPQTGEEPVFVFADAPALELVVPAAENHGRDEVHMEAWRLFANRLQSTFPDSAQDLMSSFDALCGEERNTRSLELSLERVEDSDERAQTLAQLVEQQPALRRIHKLLPTADEQATLVALLPMYWASCPGSPEPGSSRYHALIDSLEGQRRQVTR